MDEGNLLAVALVGILAALEHTGVAALEAKGEHVEGDVWACLVDHADDAEGYGDATEAQTVGQRLLLGDMTEGGGQGGHVAHVGGYVVEALRGELQTVVKGIRSLHAGQILGVGSKYALLIACDGIGHGQEYLIALLVGEQGQAAAGTLCLLEGFCQLHNSLSI